MSNVQEYISEYWIRLVLFVSDSVATGRPGFVDRDKQFGVPEFV